MNFSGRVSSGSQDAAAMAAQAMAQRVSSQAEGESQATETPSTQAVTTQVHKKFENTPDEWGKLSTEGFFKSIPLVLEDFFIQRRVASPQGKIWRGCYERYNPTLVGIPSTEFRALYQSHDPRYARLCEVVGQLGGSQILYHLFPQETPQNIEETRVAVAQIPMSSLLPVLQMTQKPIVVGYLARFLSLEQIRAIPDPLFEQVARHLFAESALPSPHAHYQVLARRQFAQFALPVQDNDQNLGDWITVSRQRGGGRALLYILASLANEKAYDPPPEWGKPYPFFERSTLQDLLPLLASTPVDSIESGYIWCAVRESRHFGIIWAELGITQAQHHAILESVPHETLEDQQWFDLRCRQAEFAAAQKIYFSRFMN